jgi:methylated-DNA-[protein]-cysteine S-methyltransferase
MIFSYLDSPLGRLLLAGEPGALALIGFSSGRRARDAEPGWRRDDAAFDEVRRQLTEYFAGTRRRFDLVLAPRLTPFQARVLAVLQTIPYGETRSYREVAAALGQPRAVRAVGAANGANPLPLVIPCHRVIGSGGSLTGFAGGLEAKRYLLNLERRHAAPCAAPA